MSKITIDRELLEQAIAALSYCEPDWKENTHGFDLWANVLPPLREALTQPQPVQEPVAVVDDAGVIVVCSYKYKPGDKLYTSPQAQPLTVAGGAVFQDAEGKRPVTAMGQPVGQWEPTPLFPPGGAGVFLERPQAQPLSEERVREIYESTTGLDFYRNFARAIEQAHGITKGTT